VVVNDRLRNVPGEGIYNWEPGAFFGVYHPDTFWFEDGAATAERATPTASAPDLLWLEGGSAAPVD
jgi:peptide/nickel transport system substrate-binding protein